ncbi:aminotransferase class V-fold PLP-dependent enzyme [Prochlorococcus sp. MIT 1223]|uniref:aminotransferase class V-fold PLP-dependent enzyme n=1 Tax=Prochlorococcus sp. MIT 1223 TaxID=3096217 RepID=UPI002A75929A|nr:aminotransferase class V-fold PLP-dependent enzyme [Prochlorococcus sp. MIT 1223]
MRLGTSSDKEQALNLRDLMPALQNKSYFNYGGQGPLPSPSLDSIATSWEEIQKLGPFTNNVWPYLMNEVKKTKRYLGRLCGVSSNQIALTENVTSGCVLPLWGLPFKADQRILIGDCEHPGVIAACREIAKRNSLKIDILHVQQLREGLNERNTVDELVLKELKKAIRSNTKLVVLSHVLWNTGQIMPINLIAETLQTYPVKPYLLVDAAQSFGQIPIRDAAQTADIYAFTGHKWACGPEGLGGVAVSKRVLQDSSPTLIGWKSLQKEEGIHFANPHPFQKDARRFEIATSCIPLLAGLRCSLDLLETQGDVHSRLKRIQTLSMRLWTGLKSIEGVTTILEGPPPTGLISFTTTSNKSANTLVRHLGKKALWIRVLEDPEWLRACVHITTQESEVDTLIKEIQTSIT